MGWKQDDRDEGFVLGVRIGVGLIIFVAAVCLIDIWIYLTELQLEILLRVRSFLFE